jgi:hypothetical protein
MTPDEKIKKFNELEQAFLADVEKIKKEYQAKIKEAVATVEKSKIESLKKDLGL